MELQVWLFVNLFAFGFLVIVWGGMVFKLKLICGFFCPPPPRQTTFNYSGPHQQGGRAIIMQQIYPITNRVPTLLERRPRKLALFSGRVEQQRPISVLKGCSKTCVHSQSTRPVVEECLRNASKHTNNLSYARTNKFDVSTLKLP